jgi:cyclic beta-1,2-glucan synthetase
MTGAPRTGDERAAPDPAALGRELAARHAGAELTRPQGSVRQRVARIRRRLRAAADRLECQSDEAPAARDRQWILDNGHVLEVALAQVGNDLPAAFHRRLPALAASGRPRVGELAGLAASTLRDPAATAEGVAGLIAGYQESVPLSMAELWAFPTLLRLALLEQLTVRSEAVAEGLETGDERGIDADRGILTLRRLAAIDWREIFERASGVELLLRGDPAEVYARMDFASRDRYRKVIEKLAARDPMREAAVAEAVLRLATQGSHGARERHVGWYLIDRGRERLEREIGYRLRGARERGRRLVLVHPRTALFAGIASGVAGLLGLLAATGIAEGWGGAMLFGLLALGLPLAATVAETILRGTLGALLEPRVLPKLDFDEGVPPECRTLVAFPVLIGSVAEVGHLLRALEVNALANPDPELGFALLTDWNDAPEASLPDDAEILARAVAGVERLNANGATRFHLLHRARRFNPAEGCWMGWERKRGKLEELNRLLLGERDGFATRIGDVAFLAGVRYVITLDADTVLPHEAARRLIGALAHPLNAAELAPDGRVVRGFGVLQPRTEVLPESARRSHFARLLAGALGPDLYHAAVSNLHQDLLGVGIYAGKGIYDVRAFAASLRDRVPENRVLSHDLFEGLHARAALVSDVSVYEEVPSHVLGELARAHRWARGDWQLLPWLGRRVPVRGGDRAPSRFGAVGRWLLLDNLRRTLVPPATLALLGAGLIALPGDHRIWMLVALGPLLAPWLLEGLRLLRRIFAVRRGWTFSVVETARLLARGVVRSAVELMLLPVRAQILVDAVARTLYRLFASRRNLLEWRTAARAARGLGPEPPLRAYVRGLWAAPAVAAALAAVAVTSAGEGGGYVAGLALVWLVAPAGAWWLGRPRDVDRRSRADLGDADRLRLRVLARRTWNFFERFVRPEDHWLPPDNFQEEPHGMLARRTSPTNVGLYLTSILAAYDLGHLDARRMASRLRNTLDTLARLERYRGHFWNWTSTDTLAPLAPRYVSTVDSGNLAAALVTVACACEEVLAAPVVRFERAAGIADAVAVLREVVEGIQRGIASARGREVARALRTFESDLRDPLHGERDWLERVASARATVLPTIERALEMWVDEELSAAAATDKLAEIAAWLERVRHELDAEVTDLSCFVPWCDPARRDEVAAGRLVHGELPQRVVWSELAATCAELRKRVAKPAAPDATAFTDRLGSACDEARSLATELGALAELARGLALGMDFSFLFDERRKLFRIGFDADRGERDPNHYDLLASEARLTSFWAIAKGDVPVEHWLHLGRPYGRIAGERALLSWGGTAFEYLLPEIFLRVPRGTPLARSSAAAVRRQRSWARSRGAPWGVSESAFHSQGAHEWYQYRAFGVPGTGLRRGLGDRLVVAPYASLLALRVAPLAVARNLERLEAAGAAASFGFYEALDYGPARPRARRPAVVRSFMSHHQGMILAAIVNFLAGAPLVRRFHSDPRVAAAAILLHEEARFAPLADVRLGVERLPEPAEVQLPAWRAMDPAVRADLHVLSNGRLSSVITTAGGGGLRWRGMALTPWHTDPTLETHGTWIYLRDLESGAIWSVALAPTAASGELYEVELAPHQVEIRRRDEGIRLQTTIGVAPEPDVELRLLQLVNESNRRRYLSVTAFVEMAMAQVEEAGRHPAFARLFVECERVVGRHAWVFRRRPRHAGEAQLFVGVALVPGPVRFGDGNRESFLGRGGSADRPRFPPTGSAGADGGSAATLDPAAVLEARLELAPDEHRRLALVTAAGDSRAAVLGALERAGDPASVEALFDDACRRAEEAVRELDLSGEDLRTAQRLLAAVLVPHPALRVAGPWRPGSGWLGQRGLWGHGISGDLPIVLVSLGGDPNRQLVRSILAIHAHWRHCCAEVDLVLLDEQEGNGYTWPLRDWLDRELGRTGALDWLHRPGGVFVLRARNLPAADRELLRHAARALVDASAPSLAPVLAALEEPPQRLPPFVPVPGGAPEGEATPRLERPSGLLCDNGFGGFTQDGREYVIHLEPGERTPAPWINVVANERAGFLVSESGASCTWVGNSGENRLTPWLNDPLLDPSGEAIYLRDEETGATWSPTPAPAGGGTCAYQVRHAAGETRFLHHRAGLLHELALFVPPGEALKLAWLRLENVWRRPRRITVTYYAEWVLGSRRSVTAPRLVTDYLHPHGILLAQNPFHPERPNQVAFLAADRRPHGFTADRREFLAGGTAGRPPALERIGLGEAVGYGLDPCAALQIHLDLPPGGVADVAFLLGAAESRDEVREVVSRYCVPGAVVAARAAASAAWDRLLGALEIETPETELDLLANRWLLYQNLSCRILGRTALYQSSGAWGFRDQLQDVGALHWAAPERTRAHLLRSAARQFVAGDVLHWWHPERARGVRTRCSDDLLWLPFAAAEYVTATGDAAVLDEEVPFLGGDELAPGQLERYDEHAPAPVRASLYEHCRRALARGATAGEHGLPLIGTCDWNDGYDRVGHRGRGESVWLAWFLAVVLERFAPIAAARGDAADATAMRAAAARYREAAEAHAWDGEWYRRAYFDDGSALGAAASREARIDLLAQAWAAWAGARPERVATALRSAFDLLAVPEQGLLRLLAPPFDRSRPSPGYVAAYPPGVRENGGQYNHAAVWAAWAAILAGDPDRALAVVRGVLPNVRAASREGALVYRLEPYVLAGDIYSEPPHAGRGGWSWYTGAAGWLYRWAVEALLGLRLRDGKLYLEPCIPSTWAGFRVRLRRGEATVYRIEVDNSGGAGRGISEVELDGRPIAGAEVPLVDDGRTHTLAVALGRTR